MRTTAQGTGSRFRDRTGAVFSRVRTGAAHAPRSETAAKGRMSITLAVITLRGSFAGEGSDLDAERKDGFKVADRTCVL